MAITNNEPRVEQFRLQDLPALLQFLRLAFPNEPPKYDPDYWNWHYVAHPLVRTDDIPLWVVKSGEKIVGQVATIPVDLKVGSEKRRSIWILDFVVLEEFRGLGLGKKLVLAAGESYPTMVTLGINEMSTAVFSSLGWKAVGGVDRYQKLLFPGNALSELRSAEALRKGANLIYAPFRPRSHSVDNELRRLSPIGAEFDELWSRSAGQWPCTASRDSGVLKWQYEEQPGKTFDIFGLYRDGTLNGYLVMFVRRDKESPYPPKAAISDICYAPDRAAETVDRLVSGAVAFALERQAGSLVTDIRDALVETSLRRHGFWRVKEGPRFMAFSPDNEHLIFEEKNWFLTRGDSDVSIFEEANT